MPSVPRGPDECPVVDGAALGALGADGGGVLGDLGRHHTSAELQDLLISQTRTLQDRNHSGYLSSIAAPQHQLSHVISSCTQS